MVEDVAEAYGIWAAVMFIFLSLTAILAVVQYAIGVIWLGASYLANQSATRARKSTSYIKFTKAMSAVKNFLRK